MPPTKTDVEQHAESHAIGLLGCLSAEQWQPLPQLARVRHNELGGSLVSWSRYIHRVAREAERLGWVELRRTATGVRARLTAEGQRARGQGRQGQPVV